MKLYISRRVQAIRSDSSGDDSGTTLKLDIIIGERDLTVHSLDGVDSAIKVFSDLIQFATFDAVQGTAIMKDDAGKEQCVTEMVIPYHGVQDFDIEKAGAVDAALGLAPDKNRDYGAYTILRGSVTLKDANVNAPDDVCLIFGPDSTGKTVYLGAAARVAKTGSSPVGESAYNYNAISGVRGISIGHVFAAANANGSTTMDYAEPGYVILETNHYYPVTGDSEIVLKKGLAGNEAPGTEDQNLYYFGITPGEAYNLGDVYLLNKPLGETKNAEDQEQIMRYEEPAGKENVPAAGQQSSGGLNGGKAVTTAIQLNGAGAQETAAAAAETSLKSEDKEDGGNVADETITGGNAADESITGENVGDENAADENITDENIVDEIIAQDTVTEGNTTGGDLEETKDDDGISGTVDGEENTPDANGMQHEEDPADGSIAEDSGTPEEEKDDAEISGTGEGEGNTPGADDEQTEGTPADENSSTETIESETIDTESSDE